MDYLHASVADGGKAAAESDVLPGEQILLDVLYGSGELRHNLEHGTFTDVAVGVAVLIYMH